MKHRFDEHNLKVILVQVDEAHSDAWPTGLIEQPAPQCCFQDRLNAADAFIRRYDVQYPVYVDNWNNDFANLFRAWPDKFHCVDRDLNIVAKAEYGADAEAVVNVDYIKILEDFML